MCLVSITEASLSSSQIPIAQNTLEHLQTRLGLIKWHFMPRLVNPHEAEFTILSHFAIFGSVHHEGSIAGLAKFMAVCVVDGERDGLATKPIANEIGVTIEERDADSFVEKVLEVFHKVRINKVAGFLEGIVYIGIGFCVIQLDTQRLLNVRKVQVLLKIGWGCGVLIWVTDAFKGVNKGLRVQI